MKKFQPSFEFSPLTITLIYLISGITWILTSDTLMRSFTSDLELVMQLERGKGILFVLLTSVLIYFLIRANNQRFNRERAAINKSLRSVNVATWSVNLKNRHISTSSNHHSFFPPDTDFRNWNLSTFYDTIHPEDRELVKRNLESAIENEKEYHVIFRVVWPDESIQWLESRGNLIYNSEHKATHISGIIANITDSKKNKEALRRQRKFMETTLENLPIGVAVNMIDTGETTFINRKFTEIYGWPKEILNNVDSFFENVYPDKGYRGKMMHQILSDIQSGNPEQMQWNGVHITTQTGEEKIVNAKNIPVFDQNLMISTVVDITAQHQAELKLAESERNYRLLFIKNPLPMWIYEPETLKFIEVNNAAVKHYGYSKEEFLSMTLLDIRPESDHEDLEEAIQKIVNNEQSPIREWRHVKKSGEVIYVRISGSNIRYFGHQYRLILVNDITQQKKAEESVLASLVEGENKERARIASELHDGLGQYLAAANMQLDSVKNELDHLNEDKRTRFQNGLNLVKHAITETARISHNLLPRVVDDYGLTLAIESLIENYKGQNNLNINYYHNIDELELSNEVQVNLFRITQESLSNAVKYADASEINIQLIVDDLDLILTIEDNGKGMNIEDIPRSSGLGLKTIKTRANALGGYLELDSKSGKGTMLTIMVPISSTS